MSLNDSLAAMQQWPLYAAIAESDWLFPSLESLYVIAITLVVGSIIVVDLRLIGVAGAKRPLAAFMAQFLPVTWTAFIFAALTGGLMFLAKPVSYAGTPFSSPSSSCCWRRASIWAPSTSSCSVRPTRAARISGLASLTIWISVVALGRWIGFTIGSVRQPPGNASRR